MLWKNKIYLIFNNVPLLFWEASAPEKLKWLKKKYPCRCGRGLGESEGQRTLSGAEAVWVVWERGGGGGERGSLSYWVSECLSGVARTYCWLCWWQCNCLPFLRPGWQCWPHWLSVGPGIGAPWRGMMGTNCPWRHHHETEQHPLVSNRTQGDSN